YEATVDGNATLSIDVPIDQVDDILKSLVVYDDGGTAGEITLPGREPLTQAFVDLPFDRAALDSAPALLNALQGADVRVTGAKPMPGGAVLDKPRMYEPPPRLRLNERALAGDWTVKKD